MTIAELAFADAIYLVRTVGLSEARQYAEKMPANARWDMIRALLADLHPHETREASIRRLQRQGFRKEMEESQ